MNRKDLINDVTEYEFKNIVGIDNYQNNTHCLIIRTSNLEIIVNNISTIGFTHNIKNQIYNELCKFEEEKLKKIWFNKI